MNRKCRGASGHLSVGLGIRTRANQVLSWCEAGLSLLGRDMAKHRIGNFDGDSHGNWFLVDHDLADWIDADAASTILHSADLIINHHFDILGTGLTEWGKRINWHLDIRSKRVWPLHYYKRLLHNLTGIKGSDVKIPWELSRFQHLLPLLQAYRISGNGRYAQEALHQIADWIDSNPFLYGINWTSAMEAAIRACNWIWAWWAFKDDSAWSEEFNQQFMKSLRQHGQYIKSNLEDRGGIRTNHYLFDVVGLLFLGLMFTGFKGAIRWKEFGVKELVRCMEEMVYPDGVSFENSTAYHRLVLELFTYSAILCKRNGIELPRMFWERLEKMFEFVMCCTRPDGRMPIIGDADDGRLFILSDYYDWDRWDFRYLLSIGAVIFSRADFRDVAGKCHEEVAWVLGREGVVQWHRL